MVGKLSRHFNAHVCGPQMCVPIRVCVFLLFQRRRCTVLLKTFQETSDVHRFLPHSPEHSAKRKVGPLQVAKDTLWSEASLGGERSGPLDREQ